MSSATEMWLSAEKISVPLGSPVRPPSLACPCRFLGAPKPSGGYMVVGGWWVGDGAVGVDIFGTPIRLWGWAFRWLPGHRQFIHAVRETVVLEGHLVERD